MSILIYSAVKGAFHIAPPYYKIALTFSIAEIHPKVDKILELYSNYILHSVPFSLYHVPWKGFLPLKRKGETEKEISFCAIFFCVTKSLDQEKVEWSMQILPKIKDA